MGSQYVQKGIDLKDRFHYDPAKNVFHVNLDGLEVKSADDLKRIEFLVAETLSPLNKRVSTIVNYDNFEIDSSLIKPYTEMVNRLMEHFYLDVTRYTSCNELRKQLGLALEEENVTPNIFKTSAEAEVALKALK